MATPCFMFVSTESKRRLAFGKLFRLRGESRLGLDGFPVQKEKDADEGRDRERDGKAA